MPRSVTSRTAPRPTSRRRLGRSLSRGKRSSRQPSVSSSDAEEAPRGTQKDPLHVLTRDTPIGWAVIQKAVDDFDRDQIEGVKNDIDTLLVFIGLFSAVLSTFLAIAVALLQEDIPGATLTTLRQMSVQNANYTIQGDFIISASPAPTSFTQFEPTPNAVRINDLWTASLIISLITASFGILVKQWLREYMKFVTSFPQGRLRIRQFRRAGLETWKVLTIAACLPLLLQLALGLFFIGLCFYTAELHSSVRNTTLPLVSGWGFIFFFVTISPLFSAHCPYKTPALDSLVIAVRPSIRALIRATIITLWITAVGALQKFAHYIYQYTPVNSTREQVAKMVRDRAEEYLIRLENPKGPYDEAAAAKHEADDLDIMVAADELQGNDEIVGTAMVDALQQITPLPEDIIRFVLQILQHRVPWEGDFSSKPQVIDCSMAAARALDSILSLLEQHLPINRIPVPSEGDPESANLASWTAALYLSVGISHGFDRVPALSFGDSNERLEIFVIVAVSTPSSLGLNYLLHLTCQSCRKSKLDLPQSLSAIACVVEPFFRKLGLTDSFESDDHDVPWREVLNINSLRDTVVFLTDLLRGDTVAQDDEWSDAQYDALSLIIRLAATVPPGFTDCVAAVRRMTLLSKSVMQKLLISLIKFYPNTLYNYAHDRDFRTDIEALSHLRAAIETITTSSPDKLTRPSALMACRIIVQVFEDRRDIKGRALIESWRRIFGALASLVQVSRVLEDGTDDEVEHISICFNWLSSVDARNEDDDRDDRGKYLAWRAAFKPEESPVPDSFYLVLMDIYVPDERYWRVGRLQEMTAQEREAAAKDTLDNNAVDPSTGRDDGPIKDDEHGPGSTGGQVSTDPVDEESPDDVSSEDVLPEPGDDPDVIIRDGGQGLVSSGDGGEKAGTDLGRDEGILDEVLHRSEGEHVTTFR